MRSIFISLRTAAVAGLVLTFGMFGLTTSVFAQVNPGDVLVLDRENDLAGKGLFSVIPASGSRKVISDLNNPDQDDPALVSDELSRSFILKDVAVSASGDIVILDSRSSETGTTGADVLFRVDPINGFRTLLSNFTDPSQGVVGFPDSVAFDGDEILVLGEFVIFGNRHDALVRVDRDGFRTLLVDFQGTLSTGIGSPGFEGITTENSLAVDASGNIFVLDVQGFFRGGEFFSGDLFKVDPARVDPPFAGRTLLSDFANAGQGEAGVQPDTLTVDSSGAIWIADTNVGDQDVLFRIDPNSGSRTVVVRDLTVTCAPGLYFSGLAVDAAGNILLAAEIVRGQDPGILFSFNPTTGVCSAVTDFAVRAQGEIGERMGQVAVVPAPITDPVDLTIANIEITQTIQNRGPIAELGIDRGNVVPLVQGKTTYVRVYPRVDVADRRVGGRLRGFRGGVELPGSPLRPLYPLTTVRTTGAKRANFNDSFNFWIPPEWLSGNVSFQAEINFGGAVPETDFVNNVRSEAAHFVPKAPVCVVVIPVRTQAPRYTVESPGFWNIIDRFETLWPVPNVQVYSPSATVEELQARFGIPPWEFGPYELGQGASLTNGPADQDKIIISLIARAQFTDDPDECTENKARTHYVGMVHPDTKEGNDGYASLIFAASWVKMLGNTHPAQPGYTPPLYDRPLSGAVMAQELSHNYNGFSTQFGRWTHVNCGNPPSTFDFYPYDPATIGVQGEDTFWGFDPITRQIIPPDKAADYMSYCRPSWVSDFNYGRGGMFDEIRTLGDMQVQSIQTTSASVELGQSAEILFTAGVVDRNAGGANFEIAYRLPQGILSADKLEQLQASLTDNPAGAYVLELLDAGGAVLFSQPFKTLDSSKESTAEVFSLAVPFNVNTAQVRITRDSQVLGVLSVSSHAPQVQVLEPAGETITDRLTIRWEGSDQENDTLFYTVQYSPDLGTTWQTLVTETPNTSLTLDDIRSLPGSDEALIRVIANDGVNTGSATSAPFTVQSQAPIIHIDTPSSQALFVPDSQIILTGGASDAEDGEVSDEGLQWLLNGEIVGSGPEAAVGGLPVGVHDVTLKATDSHGNTASASLRITVTDVPVADADSYSTPTSTQLTVDVPGVLGNDIDPEGDLLSAVLVSDVSNGALSLNADGSFVYMPNADFAGADSFTYKASDGRTESTAVTVSLTIGVIEIPVSEPADDPGTGMNEDPDPGTEPTEPVVACAGFAVTMDCTVNGNHKQPCLGTSGRDIIQGSIRADVIHGLRGNDNIGGRGGNDFICGGSGADHLSGEDGSDRLFGGSQNDVLIGNRGSDRLFGRNGSDVLFGNRGNDLLNGGKQADRCADDAGRNTFLSCRRSVLQSSGESN